MTTSLPAGTVDAKGRARCAAKTRGGGYCMQAPGWGTDHPGWGRCKLHGGSNPSGKKHAQKLMAAAAVITYGLPREVDPHTALLEEVHRTAGHVAWLAGRVAELEQEALVWGTTKVVTGDESSATEEARPNAWLILYQQERKHLAAVCSTAIQAGIAERQVRLAEEQGAMIAQVIRGVLEDLGVADRPEVPDVVRRRLVAVSPSHAG